MRLHLGSGKNYKKDWVNVDKDHKVKADYHIDLEYGVPFDDDSIDEIFARHIIEHIENDVLLFNDMWRICKNGATIRIDVPTQNSMGAIDWGHKSYWNLRKFNYLNKDNRSNYTGLECDFKIIKHSYHTEGDKPFATEVLSILLEAVK